jgi:3',5'-cyclic-AMP phosphodiesterase
MNASASNPTRCLRFVHMTDVHIQPERQAAEGFALCLEKIHALAPRPDFILNGGDAIMDAVAADFTRTKLQWDVWDAVVKDCALPMVHCLGNHDIWGWKRRKSGCLGNEALYGKRFPMERLQITERYRSFDRAGWHFVILDSSVEGGEEGYTARLDEEQKEWFCADLAATPSSVPIIVVSHIPLLAGGSIFFSGSLGETERTGNWVIPGSWMHIDARAINQILHRHPNVRLCLSGHTHLHDRLDYNGITYLCSGAASGKWWRGNHNETPPGFCLLDLFSDGTFHYEYIPTGWLASP